uniref:C2H2-type domain-containing protein n=1 Tax=viral metagenome TaxID=1070528 RepID=A0A6C0IR50_9ZZZZ
MTTNFSEKCEKSNSFFECKICDYICCLKQHYVQHCKSKKHNLLISNTNYNNSIEKSVKHDCVCGKKYADRAGLWRHKKSCSIINPSSKNNNNNNNSNDDTIKELVGLMKEMVKNGIYSNNTTNNTNTNSHNNINNTFNLKVYLNETCKNAMNLSEFIENIEPTMEELELTGREGYVKGISHIFSTRLDETSSEESPIHCTDGKREVFYIKENNVWNKEDEEKTLLIKALRQLSQKNIGAILKWKNLHPDCTESDSRKNDKFLKITFNAMPGSTQEECDNNYKKIISNMAKKTIIQK